MNLRDAEAFAAAYVERASSTSTLNDPSVDLVRALSQFEDGPETASGVRVSPETALRYIAVYSAVRYLSESIGSLPFKVYRRDGRSRIPVGIDEDIRAFLLDEEPNPYMSAMTFWETLVGHANLWGNAYAYVEFSARYGRTVALWPLDPRTTRPERTPTGELRYVMQTDSGLVSLSADEVIHIRAFGTGDVGISPIGVARQAIGEQLAAEEYAGRFWQNDARPGGVIQYEKKLTDDDHKEATRRWESMHRGVRRSHLVAVLDRGATWKDVGIHHGDAQFLESRKWGVRQIASLFRVPPHKIGDLEGTVTFASIDAQELSAVVDSLRPWVTRVEQATKRTMFYPYSNVETLTLSEDGRKRIYPQFQMDALLRGDVKTRHMVYGIGRQWGYYSANDVLELEDRPSIGADGDVYLQPVNMVPAGTDVTTMGKPAPVADSGDGEEEDDSARALLALTQALSKLGPGASDQIRGLADAIDAENRSV